MSIGMNNNAPFSPALTPQEINMQFSLLKDGAPYNEISS